MNGGKYSLVLCGVIAMLAAPAKSQDEEIRLQRALDQPVNLEVADAPIDEVFQRLQKATGVKFVIDPDTMDFLPYGNQTRLAVTLKSVVLRKALTPMLAPQALQWEVDGQVVRIRPTEALYRLCRRATYEELTTLGQLHSQKLLPTDRAEAVVQQLRRLPGQEKLELFFHVKGDSEEVYRRAERALPGTGAEWLNVLCHGQDWTWTLRENKIVIMDKAMQLQSQLAQSLSLRYQNAPLIDVLLDLARQGRFKLSLQPGVMNTLPSSMAENFNLTMAEATIYEALEVISGATGLEFIHRGEGIHVEASEALKQQVAAVRDRRSGRPRFFVRMTLPGPNGTQIEVFMRPEELPEDILKEIEKAKDTFIAEIRGEVEIQPEE